MRSKVLLVFASIVLAAGLCPGLALAGEGSEGLDLVAFDPGDLTTQSGEQLEASSTELSTQASPIPTAVDNVWGHDYARTASTSKSFLHVNGGSLERVQYTGGALVVETVSSDFKGVTAQRTIPASTYQPSNLASGSSCQWGGFYSGSGYNYVATGQGNGSQDDSRVVFRITKYTKDWSFVGAAEVRGANTTGPFSAGSCDMVEYGGKLYVRTCHTMYTSDDGLRHQANVQLVINESNMSVTDQYTSVSYQGNDGGYVSHSFNQHLAVLSGGVYGLDHGDAYPRAVTIKRLYGDYTNVMTFPGEIGDNYTGATTGGFESSSAAGRLLSVGSRTADGSTSSSTPRNVWVAATPGGLGSSSVRNVTSYTTSSSEWADNPFLVKVNDNRFLVLWGIKSSQDSHTGKIAYQFVDGNGNALTSVIEQQGVLSDCEPVLYNGNIVWYASGGGAPSYYMINASTGSYSKVETLGSAIMEVDGTQWDWYDWRTSEFVHALPLYYVCECPDTTVTLGGAQLVEGTDYTLQYSIDHAKAQGTVTAVGKGRFAGQKKSVTFDIIPGSLEECTISGITDKTYNGSAIAQDVEVNYYYAVEGGFVEGRDFTLSYTDNVNAGTATVTIVGKGLLSGTVSERFTINKASLSGAAVSGVNNKSYNGSAQTQSPTVKVGGRTLKLDTDYTLSYENNVNAGTATMNVVGKGNYEGTKSITFEIAKADVSKAAVALSATSYTYDGKAKEPAVTVKLGGRTLTSGTDYTVAYAGNVNAGTAAVTVTGKGNYQKAKPATFEIKPASVAGAAVTLSPASYSYNGTARVPKIEVVVGGRMLKGGTDYTVALKDNVKVGIATATVAGKGNYAGIATARFAIAKGDISKAAVALSATSYTYDGKAKEPAVTVKLDGVTLKPGTDYAVEYKNNTAAGTATATVTGKGSYEGLKSATFAIAPIVKRLWGDDALKTMSAIVDAGGFKKGGTVMVATKDDYYDALTAAGYAGLADAPVLLTAKGSLSPDTSAQIKKLAPTRIVVCGGTAAVSANVEGQLRAAAPKAAVERAWGQNAIGTANDVALKAAKSTGKRFSGACFVATPNGYWDALAAAPVAYALGMPVFLANFDGTIDGATLKAMRELGITKAYVAGGYMALPKTVESQLAAAKVKVEKRFAGRNACDTSQLIAAFGVSQGLSANKTGVATRDGYWDALCGAALCGHSRSVLVLAADDDRTAINGFVKSHAGGVSVAYVFGGPAAVSDATFASLKAAIG